MNYFLNRSATGNKSSICISVIDNWNNEKEWHCRSLKCDASVIQSEHNTCCPPKHSTTSLVHDGSPMLSVLPHSFYPCSMQTIHTVQLFTSNLTQLYSIFHRCTNEWNTGRYMNKYYKTTLLSLKPLVSDITCFWSS